MRSALLVALVASCARRADPPGRVEHAANQAAPAPSVSATVKTVEPERAPAAFLAGVDRVVEEAIARGDAPGAVVEVWSHDRLVHRRAYGLRRVRAPSTDAMPMTVDTVFDLASLTKPLATAMSIHLLAADKKISLSDRARRWLPELGEHQDAITIEHLLLHTSGLPAADAVSAFQAGEKAAIERIGRIPLASTPGATHVYSDLGFVLLGAIVERASGKRLDTFAQERLFLPLGLKDTRFLPPPSPRIAPTARDGVAIEGVVHDPRASALGGVAGHAGLFSTASDVATIGRMLLHGGELDGVRVLPREVVTTMTRAVRLANAQRTLGWDVHGAGFGHTGFTGTSIFVDPREELVIVLLTSRLHPDEKGDVRRLRKELDDVVHAALSTTGVQTGIDVLEREAFARLANKKVALVTNRSAVDRAGVRTVDAMRAHGVDVVALLAPEHGLDANEDAFVASGIDAKTGIPVRSLYGADRKKPVASDLLGADVLVFDLQDAGVRFYTYETTLGLVLESAKELKLPLIVLDRPNPLGGAIEGPMLDEGRTSFTAYHRVPIRHGMTVGELARFFDGERHIGAQLDVVKMIDWRRDMLFRDTRLAWFAPSPNLRSDVEALLYPGVALLEGTNVSVGRGTSTPFEVVGAPYVDGDALAKRLNAFALPGVSFKSTRFTPKSSTHAGKECRGVAIAVSDPAKLSPVRMGIALALAMTHEPEWQSKNLLAIIGNEATVRAIERSDPLEAIVASWAADERAFTERRRPYLLY